MKRFATYLLYIAGWIGITIVYICSTQLDEPVNVKLTRLYQQHRMSRMEAAADDIPSAPPALAHKHKCKQHRKNKHFAPLSKSKANHKETHVRPIVPALDDAEPVVLSAVPDTEAIAYVNYLKQNYRYLFFKEINPPPPKLLYRIA